MRNCRRTMSFCIRNIANGSKYVPAIVASAQGCNTARRFSSRQLPKHVRPATSTFLNEFMGQNTMSTLSYDVRENCKLPDTSEESNATLPQPTYIYVNQWLNDIDSTTNKNDIESYTILNKKDLEFDSQDINRISYIHTEIDQTVFSHNLNPVLPHKDNISVTYQEQNWNHQNQTYIVNMSPVTKEKPKFSTIPKAASVLKERSVNSQDNKPNTDRRPTEEELQHIYNTLSIDLPDFFSRTIDYRIYSANVEFVNNFRGTTTKTAYEYAKQLAFLRIIGHLKYANVKLEVLKITLHTADNTIRVRWRIRGIPGWKLITLFWKVKLWQIRSDTVKEQEFWYDGYSTYYVGEDGLVYKHVADKMMPDQDVEDRSKTGLQSKLASQLGA